MSPTDRSASQEEREIARTRSFEEAFQQYWERIYRVLFRLTGDTAEAEDLALETFWRLWQKPPADGHSLGGWLYRVAAHLGYNTLRARQRRWQYEQHAGRTVLEESDPTGPENAAELSEERQCVRSSLNRLPERQAKLLILRHSGLSYQELAAALDLNPASVGTLLARAEKAFLEQYGSAPAFAEGGNTTPALAERGQKGAEDAPE